ncbi:MAG TPA: Ig-like domain-containing protein, partial [Candidatus Rifleibacterium sp.]|nr:Ig-like domain-containing protein [Candidatus Rifleibacterium sp.]
PYSSNISIELLAGINDANGLPVKLPHSFTFGTEAAPQTFAQLLELSPASGTLINANRQLAIRFDQAMQTDKTEAAIVLVPAPAGVLNFAWSADNVLVTLTAPQNLAFASNYKLTIASSAISASGDRLLQDYIASYSTNIQTMVTGNSPQNGQTSVATGTIISIVFSRQIAATFDNSLFRVSSGSTQLPGAITVTGQTISFAPASPLPYSGNITVEALAGIKDSDGLPIDLPHTFSFTTAAAPPPAFTAGSIVPADGSTNLPITQAFEIVFSNPVQTDSLQYICQPSPVGGFNSLWSNGNRTLQLTPVNNLAFSQTYQITISSNTRDIYGSLLSLDYSTSFSTRAAVRPVISSTLPLAGSTNVSPDQQLRVDFSKTMQRAAVGAAITMNPPPAGTILSTWQNDDKTLLVTFSQPLSHGVSYQFRVGAAAADTEGLTIESAYLLSFATTVRPAILLSKCLPTENANGVAVTDSISIEFSKVMDQTSAQSAFRLVKDGETDTVAGSFAWDGKIMTFNPSANMAFYTKYQLSIAATAMDTSGIALASAAGWSFTTAPDEGRIWRLDQAQTTTTGTFSARKDHVMVSFNSKLWVIGGRGDEFSNDVWSSTDGISWVEEKANGAAGMFAARAGHACAVFNNRIWLTGGYSETDTDYLLFDDVWSSGDGKTWVQETNSAEYYSRAWHNMAVYDNKLWILAGETVDQDGNHVLLDECWSSSNGITWQLRSNVVSFFPRKQAQSGVIGGKLWVWGGYGKNSSGQIGPLNDIWSTINGDTWVYEKSNAEFSARCGHGMTIFNNRAWISGGSTSHDEFSASFFNDLWASNDGLNWVEVLGNTAGSGQQFSPRAWLQLSTLGDRLYSSGGDDRGTTFNEVWSTK